MATPAFYLCLDLAPMEGSVALCQRGAAPKEREIPGSLRHTEQIIPTIDTLLKEEQVSLASLAGIILNRGPGSFTGLRVAFSTAKALAFSRGLSLHSVCGVEARKWGALKELGVDVDAQVVTCLTQEKFLLGVNEIISRAEMEKNLSTERVWVIDPATAKVFNVVESDRIKIFGSKARFLGAALFEGQSRRDYLSDKDRIGAEPEYFGTTRYASVGGDFFVPQTRS